MYFLPDALHMLRTLSAIFIDYYYNHRVFFSLWSSCLDIQVFLFPTQSAWAAEYTNYFSAKG